jgi:hypothetical protein
LQRISKEAKRSCKEVGSKGRRDRKEEEETQAKTVKAVNSGSGPYYQTYISGEFRIMTLEKYWKTIHIL